MNEKFFDLPEEKRNAIINAGFSVFSQSEYRHATTDEIVKQAGISKGLLFHYFGNKKNFYIYLYEYALAFLVEHTSELYDYEETDFFDSFASAQVCKMQVLNEHPNVVEFLVKAYLDKAHEATEETDMNFQAVLDQSSTGFLNRIDPSKFKEGITPAQTLDIVIWMSEGYMRSRTPEQLKDLEAVNDEFMHYLDILKQQFYKEEYL